MSCPNFYQERKQLIDTYFNVDTQSDVSSLIADLKLDDRGTERIRQILHSTLRDAFYTTLLGNDQFYFKAYLNA